ncbi:MAG TPA: DotU family type IV/VI secretion system protein [Archangium sp.]|uniref:DotU family type IV/VI secretion system protein n=1 Tax=Archangium sp. TaxID=1872627 RepID=UPI002E2EA53C|nr:DotU family type IV/VI secretion system protein [Archangium sp.]HEX5750982.1 DotU family type IV/VI secretion system protein [Archangium sp.]
MDRVNETTKDCFDVIIQLRNAEAAAVPPPEILNHRLRGVVDEVLRRATSLGFSHQDAQDITYALVGLIDEVILGKPEDYRQFWMSNLLQLRYFDENMAGDGFFDRLSAIRKDPHRTEVLRVYYTCLLFGFQGRYRIRGGELELLTLIDGVKKDLERASPFDFDVLSPHGERPSERLTAAKRRASVLVISMGAMVLALLVYSGLLLMLDRSASQMLHQIELHLNSIAREVP